MGKPKQSLDSSVRPIRPPSIDSHVSTDIRSDGSKFLSKLSQFQLKRMARKANPRVTIRCLQQFKSRLHTRGLLTGGESKRMIIQIENDMEDIVCEEMQSEEGRTLCSLTDEEIALLIPSALRGILETTEKFSLQPIPQYFEADFERTTGIVLSINEAGCRLIIDVFMKAAVDMARHYFKLPELILCPEYSLGSVDLGIEGLQDVSGRIDYVTAVIDTGVNTSKALQAKILQSYPNTRALCSLFEAKSNSMIALPNSKAEAIGGLLVLRKHSPSLDGYNGVISDGLSWTFIRLTSASYLYMTTPLLASTALDREMVLNFLMRWIVGDNPELDSAYRLSPPPSRSFRRSVGGRY